MPNQFEIVVDPDDIDDISHITKLVYLKIKRQIQPSDYRIVKKSVDARSKFPKFRLQIEIVNENENRAKTVIPYKEASPAITVVIIGAGPAGYFAALELLTYGIKPVILERGRDVRTRRDDVRRILRNNSVNQDSNYCFGEGGAGAYSDGKLNTRSTKRGDVTAILKILTAHGAPNQILIDAYPHVGSEKLPLIVENIRKTILYYGGDIHFNARAIDFILHKDAIAGVQTESKGVFSADAVILAPGHSARDLFHLFLEKQLLIEAKPFAMGVRVEHPQELIDQLRYHHTPRHPKLPPADYRVACKIDGRGVYSFCMCPGGHIVPTPTEQEEVVVNGMSFSTRKSRYANSGMVVEIQTSDAAAYSAGGYPGTLLYQKHLEKAAFAAGGGLNLCAPAQRMTDFISQKQSPSLPKTSYLPGVRSAPLHELLPEPIRFRLQEAFLYFGKQLKGFLTQEAVLVGVESRTSSPVRIPRDSDSLTHPQIRNLYPCGEGSGYAGGIVSSAMDGQKIARRIAAVFNK